MIRGRHRGLPVAIDRAVMLPHEFSKKDKGDTEEPVHQDDETEDEDEQLEMHRSEAAERSGQDARP